MTVMVLQIEGDDDTLQEGFRALNKALESIAAPPLLKVLTADQVSQIQYHETDEQEDEAEIIEEVQRARSAPRKPPKSPVIVDLPLQDQSVPLKDFLNPDPHETNKRYLMIAYWLKRQLGINSISQDHIHTCFRHMGWTTPRDATQPLRDMKSKNEWFGKGEEKAHYKINHIGENEVIKLSADVNALPWTS